MTLGTSRTARAGVLGFRDLKDEENFLVVMNLMGSGDSDNLVYDIGNLVDKCSFGDKFLGRMRVKLGLGGEEKDEEVYGRIFKVVELVGQGEGGN